MPIWSALAAVVAASFAAATPATAHATAPPPDAVLQITTDYPSVSAQAGDTVTFELEVLSPRRSEVDLAVVDAPDGWETTMRGGGFEIDAVTAAPDSAPTFDLEVIVPPSAEPDTYRFAVDARSRDGDRDRVDLAVTVADRPVGGIQLATEFASLRGRASDTFRYDLQVTNQTPDEITLAFDGRGPDGWTVTAGPASEARASTVTIEAGASETVRVEADPPTDTAAGSYEIVVTANGGGQSGSFTLTAQVTGQPSIQLVSPNDRLDVTGNAGDDNIVTVIIANDGSAPLEDVTLSADPPSDWNVEFDPAEISFVDAGMTKTVTVTITPAGNAVTGDYALGISARAGGETADLAYRYTVETSRWWGAIGIAIIVAAFVVLFGVFRRFGRR